MSRLLVNFHFHRVGFMRRRYGCHARQ